MSTSQGQRELGMNRPIARRDFPQMDVMANVTNVTTMSGCVECHQQMKAGTGCEFCHEGK
jgi:hypothetical protein